MSEKPASRQGFHLASGDATDLGSIFVSIFQKMRRIDDEQKPIDHGMKEYKASLDDSIDERTSCGRKTFR